MAINIIKIHNIKIKIIGEEDNMAYKGKAVSEANPDIIKINIKIVDSSNINPNTRPTNKIHNPKKSTRN